MKSPLKKITYIFLLVVILPVIVFAIFEVGSLNKNEEIIRDIYKNQLDAILYSINQYSDDIVNSWANHLDGLNYRDKNAAYIDDVFKVINESQSLEWIGLSNRDGSLSKIFHSDTTIQYPAGEELQKIIKEKQQIFDKLIRYQESGFRKMEPIQAADFPNLIILFFVLDQKSQPFEFCFMALQPEEFISRTLSPKIQNISQEKFLISAYKMSNDSLVFSTMQVESDLSTFDYQDVNESEGEEDKPDVQQRDFWLLPGYYLGISQMGTSLTEVVQTRSYTNLALLILLILTLLFGLFFLYRNISREVQLSQAKSEFVSNVSHEIRTPLSLIHMFAETLEMNRVKSEEKKHEYYDIIRKESERLSRIVNRILSFSQIEANKRRFEFQDVNMNELVGEILQSYEFHLTNKGFTFQYSHPDNCNIISGDKEAISEAIINLIDNAIKYSKDKKHLDINLKSENNHVSLEIKDQGIGIPKSHQEDIFQQFYRVPTGDVHNAKGSGLGLTLVKKIIDAHSGNIRLESSPGKGSSFMLVFPIKKSISHEQ